MMRIALTDRFQRDARELQGAQRAAMFDMILSLPPAIGSPHLHAGLGIRKIHSSGIWEARMGLGLRVIVAIEKDLLSFVRIGSHDEIKRYLKTI